MSLIKHSSAIEFLGPHLNTIRQSMVDGWKMWEEIPSKHRIALSSNARATMVHDFTIDRASKLLTDARIFDKSSLKLFVFENVCLRFKKFDTHLSSKNQPTSQVINFRNQQQLDGIPAIYNLEAGYILNEIEQKITNFYLVCPNGPNNYWEMELLEEGSTTSVIDIFEGASDQDDVSQLPIRYRRKKAAKIVPFE